MDCCKSALIYDPQNIRAWIMMGNLYDEIDEQDKALEQLRYAMQYDEKNPEIYYLMGYIYAEMEQFKKAREFMERAVELDPKHEDALRDLEVIKGLFPA